MPFSVRIPEAEQDKQLRAKLLAEAPGILAWAVRGCLDWQRDGFGEPLEVREATAGYRAEMDILGAFLEDRCITHERARVTAKALYISYGQWCDETGEKPLTQKAVGLRLAERGFESAQIGKARARTWLGLGLRTDEAPPRESEGGGANASEGVNASERDFQHNASKSEPREDLWENTFQRVHQENTFTPPRPDAPRDDEYEDGAL